MCRIQVGRSEGIRGQPEPIEISFLRRGGPLRGLRDDRTGRWRAEERTYQESGCRVGHKCVMEGL